MQHLTFELEPVPPFRLDLTAWALKRRPSNEIDRWDGQTFQRALVVDNRAVAVAVTQTAPIETPHLHVTLESRHDLPSIESASRALRRLLGLDIDLSAFYAFAQSDEHLAPVVQRFRGFKPPRYATLFEALVIAIAAQQVNLTLAMQLLNRLAVNYGALVSDLLLLPQPAALIHRDLEELRKLGFSGQKARTIIELASVALEGRLSIDELAALDDEAAIHYLRQFRGIGSWTAQYVLLRGLGRVHIYPGNDSGARNSLQRWLGLSLDDAGVHRTFERWYPYAGLIYLHLLLRGIAETQPI
jgi:DNA-3-methyladenine glycosylase II